MNPTPVQRLHLIATLALSILAGSLYMPLKWMLAGRGWSPGRSAAVAALVLLAAGLIASRLSQAILESAARTRMQGGE
jgi:hypothetical protein